MHSIDKKNIVMSFNIKYTYLESWIESMAFIRNSCAHYGRLYNEKLPKKPKIYNEDIVNGSENNRVFTVIKCIVG